MKNFLILASFFVWPFFQPVLWSQTILIESSPESQVDSLEYKILDSNIDKDSIVILIQAFDKLGNFITGMAQKGMEHKYFKSLIDKEKKEICKDFTVVESSEKQSPGRFNFSLVLDYSGSMATDYPTMQRAAQEFVNGLSNSKFSRINFDDLIYPIDPTPTRNPKSVLKDKFSDYGGQTALIAAADAGVETLKNSPGSRFVILFTDGIENASAGVFGGVYSPIQLIENARSNKTIIYALGFGVGAYQRLSNICQSTGGEFHDATNDLIGSFKHLQSVTFSNYYILKAKCSKIPESILISKGNGKGTITIPIALNGVNTPIPADPGYIEQFGTLNFSMGTNIINEKDKKKIVELSKKIAIYLISNPNSHIEIGGHASPDGEEGPNKKLSIQRARAVHNIIIDAILDSKDNNSDEALDIIEKINYKGHGEDEPIYPVDSRNNAENRRVEIQIKK